MKIVKYYTSEQEKYKIKLTTLNGLLNLTDVEIELLSWFVYFQDKYQDKDENITFHPFIRKKVRDQLGQST